MNMEITYRAYVISSKNKRLFIIIIHLSTVNNGIHKHYNDAVKKLRHVILTFPIRLDCLSYKNSLVCNK